MFNQEDPGFWELMGRYFANPKVQKDLGISMVSDETHTWIVATEGNQVLGFAAVVPSKQGVQIRRDYVLPEFLESFPNLHQQLLESALALEIVKGKRLLGSANPSQVAAYEAAGFKRDIQVGKYWRMIKEI